MALTGVGCSGPNTSHIACPSCASALSRMFPPLPQPLSTQLCVYAPPFSPACPLTEPRSPLQNVTVTLTLAGSSPGPCGTPAPAPVSPPLKLFLCLPLVQGSFSQDGCGVQLDGDTVVGLWGGGLAVARVPWGQQVPCPPPSHPCPGTSLCSKGGLSLGPPALAIPAPRRQDGLGEGCVGTARARAVPSGAPLTL